MSKQRTPEERLKELERKKELLQAQVELKKAKEKVSGLRGKK